MTLRQKFLKIVYPVFMWFTKKAYKTKSTSSKDKPEPVKSFYSLEDTTIEGKPFDFSQLKGKKVLLVNTASNCGYTNQYEELEKLYTKYHGKLVVLGFPANDFKEQEKGTDEEIATFCKKNFGVTFPLMKKSTVMKTPGQNEVFKWLTDKSQNGWNNHQPMWNFSKYLVSEEGKLINHFVPAISPLSKEILNTIEE